MAHRLQTLQGKALYALRKHTPEPVFGIIKSELGFRQFLLRGLEGAPGEWKLVTMAWNLKRMFRRLSTTAGSVVHRRACRGPAGALSAHCTSLLVPFAQTAVRRIRTASRVPTGC